MSPPRQDNPHEFFRPLITLNIGGEIFSTSQRTFEKTDDGWTFLNKFQHFPRDSDGRIFIDRDGKYFRWILNYFRDGQIQLPDKIDELKQLFSEAKFYQIERLINEIENHLNGQNENDKKRNDGLHLTLISDRQLKKIIGPLSIVQIFEIRSIVRRFLHVISTHFSLEQIHCQLTFRYDEFEIVCQPTDLLQRFVLAKKAKEFGLIVSYSEDFVYLPLESSLMNYERMIEHLSQVYRGRRLHQTSNNDHPATLIEHWFLPNNK